MSVDLADLLDAYKIEVAVPGDFSTTFPNMSDDDVVQALLSGFWSARLDGLISSWTADENGIVTPIAVGGADMPRDLQQLVVFFAGIKSVVAALRATNTTFRAKAGAVEYETQQSANTLRDILKYLTDQRNILLTRLSDLGIVNPIYFDGIAARTASISYGDINFIGS